MSASPKSSTVPQKVPVGFAAALASRSPLSLPSQALMLRPNLKSLPHKVQDTKFINNDKDFDQAIISST